MWITQTYLNSPEPNAKLHIYYLFEDYKDTHVKATLAVQRELEELSLVYTDVCMLMPNVNSSARIEGELRANQALWQRLSDNIPGLVISRKPLEKLDYASDEIFFIRLNSQGFSENGMGLSVNSKPFAQSIHELRKLVNDDLAWQYRELSRYEAEPNGIAKKVFEAVELKPGIAGFRIDLKKLFGLFSA